MTQNQTAWTAESVRSAIVRCFQRHPATKMVVSQTDIGMPVGYLHQTIFKLGVSCLENDARFFDVVIQDDLPGSSHVVFVASAEAVEQLRNKPRKKVVYRKPSSGNVGWDGHRDIGRSNVGW